MYLSELNQRTNKRTLGDKGSLAARFNEKSGCAEGRQRAAKLRKNENIRDVGRLACNLRELRARERPLALGME